MRELDRKATEVYGIPSLTLMENAGRGVAELIFKRYPSPRPPPSSFPVLRGRKEVGERGPGTLRVLVVCGKGNNGGDGFVIARYLYQKKIAVEVILLSPSSDLKGAAAIHFKKIQTLGISIHEGVRPERALSGLTPFGQKVPEQNADLIVDAIFGSGLRSDVKGIYKEAIEAINAAGKPVVAVDISSGLDADTGEVRGAAVKADVTATIAFPKHGLLCGDGPIYSGEIEVIDIGFPAGLTVV